MKNKIKNVIKSKFFLKLFLIPFGIWFLLSILTLIFETDMTLEIFIIGNIESLIIWFIIVFPIAWIHSKREEKNIKQGRTPDKIWEETSTFKKIRFTLIMSIITFVIGILLSYDTIGFSLNVQLITILLSFIPFVLFIIFIFIIYKNKQKKSVVSIFKILSVVLTCGLFFYYIIAAFYIILIEATNPMNNPKYYRFHRPESNVFPNKIPKNAENVKYTYFPGVLQGGTRYTLYYVDNNMTLDEFDDKYNDQAEWVGHMDDYKENRGLLDGAFFFTPSEYKNENDYVIYLINGRCDSSGYCNHGSFLIAAFNEKTHEVVYSTEIW